jgi:hypothetical protein
MSDERQQETEDVVIRPVRWMPSAWDRLVEAADVLTARNHVKTYPVDVVRDGAMRYVDEILSQQPAKAS